MYCIVYNISAAQNAYLGRDCCPGFCDSQGSRSNDRKAVTARWQTCTPGSLSFGLARARVYGLGLGFRLKRLGSSD